MSKTYSRGEVASHNKPEDIWIVIDSEVFNVSAFQDEHPGGKKIMQGVAGQDATKKFKKYHREAILNKYKDELLVGRLDADVDEKPKVGSTFSLGFLRRKS